ncbi:MAG: hypothetical protein P1Q69_07430 [Candidatus Thorarchaeota archaeon]|nr:hypothetical protein [Candidatus Thorarchaeota archaeon]
MNQTKVFSRLAYEKSQYLLLMMLIVSPMAIMPLSIPIMSDMIVVIDRDDSVNIAVQTIKENVQNVKVVEYNSLDYALNIHRTFGKVTWVSHGSEEGILVEKETISWRKFSSMTMLTLGRDIILACESANICSFATPGSVIGFNGAVDAMLGGLVVSYLLEREQVVLEKAYERVFDIISGNVDYRPLDLSAAEGIYWLAVFLLSILAYYLGNPMAATNPTWINFVTYYLYENVITNAPGIALTLVYLALGQMDIWVGVFQLLGFIIFDVPTAFLQMAMDPFGIITDPVFIISLGLGISMIALSAYYGKLTLDVALVIVGFIFIAAGAISDFNDSNDWVG